MANTSGSSRTESRLKARAQAKVDDIEDRHTPRPKKKSHPRYKRQVFENASASINKADNLKERGQEYIDHALEYLGMLVEGPIDEVRVARLHDESVRAAQRRFATACWFKRRNSSGRTLPGMLTDRYPIDYSDARRKYPKS